eukprot:403368376
MKQFITRQLFQQSQSQAIRPASLQVMGAYPQRDYKRHSKWTVNNDYKQDMIDYTAKMSVMRKNHKKEYWQQHTQVENEFLDRFRKDRLDAQRKELDKWRTRICTISMSTKKQLQDLERKEDKLLDNMRKTDLMNMKRAMQNKIMLDVMQIDSRRWPTLLDMNSKINENVILPQTILNYQEYQQKIQNLAFYAEQGDHEAMQKILDNESIMEKKNLHLQPIFRDLKSIIKHMSYTEEYRILKEYMDGRAQIIRSIGENSEKGKEGLEMLEVEYAKLLRNYRNSLAEPEKKLKTMQKRLEDLFQLMSLWTQYVDVIYMPEIDINLLDAVNKTGARPDEASINFQNEERDLSHRMSVLFGKDEDKIQRPQQSILNKRGDEDEAYETVNEGMTSDTTEPTERSNRKSLDDEDDNKSMQSQNQDSGRKESKQEEEGILSSDEEILQSPLSQQSNIAPHNQGKLTITTQTNEDVSSFVSTEDQASQSVRQVIQDPKSMEKLEFEFNFNDQDVERYSAKIENKAQKDKDSSKYKSIDDEEDINFVGETDYNSEAFKNMNMDQLNLFGLTMEEEINTTDQKRSTQEQKKVLQDLVDMIDHFDADNQLQDFSVRKSFVYYNPYDPDEAVKYAYLKYEDQSKLRASIVLDFYLQEVEAIKDDTLTFSEKERKDQVLQLIKNLQNVKIIDAPILVKLYDLYRMRI